MIKILVTGGRDYSDVACVNKSLMEAFNFYEKKICVIQGGARGADRLAKQWCKLHGVPCIEMEAPWDTYGNKAGSVRNKWMADICVPDVCMAFPGGNGTEHMVSYAISKRIPVYRMGTSNGNQAQ